jgi:hypothetical protein
VLGSRQTPLLHENPAGHAGPLPQRASPPVSRNITSGSELHDAAAVPATTNAALNRARSRRPIPTQL